MSSHRRPAVPLVVIFAACLAAVPTASAAPEVAWTSTFGGPGADQGWAAAPTTGGGFVLAGTTDPMSTGVEDVYLIRIDDQGRKVWERTYGGDARDAARAVLQLPDGGFVLAGDTGVPPTAYDLLVIRTDADGESLWQTRIGGTGRNEGRGVCATTDGGFVVCGDAYSATAGIQFHVVKLDADGGVVWDRTYGGSDDHAYAVVETTDRGLVVCGYSGDGRTFPEFAARVFKLSAGGGMLWQRTFSLSVDDRAHDLRPLPDGGVVVAGISGGLTRLWRLDWTGFPSWSRDYPANTGDAYAVEISPHGGFYVAGYAYAYQYGAYQHQGVHSLSTPNSDS